MTRDDIIRMADEACGGKPPDGFGVMFDHDQLERFAALAEAHGAAAEREACAKICDDKVADEYATGKVDHNEMGWTQACAIAIRARGQG